jgi:hypothetical protein
MVAGAVFQQVGVCCNLEIKSDVKLQQFKAL